MENKQAKRRLKSFSFEKEGCHVSVVGPSLGSGANGRKTLVLKSLTPLGETNPSEGEGNNMEMIEKSAVDIMVQKAVDDAVSSFKAEIEVLKAAANAQVEKARKDKLEAVIGTESLEATFMAIKSLDETSFEVVLKGFEAAKSAEADSTMFTEKGVQATVPVPVEETTASRLAVKLAAQFKN